MHDIIEATHDFVKTSFMAKPHYSFNDWHIMYNHSLTVEELATRIAKDIE